MCPSVLRGEDNINAYLALEPTVTLVAGNWDQHMPQVKRESDFSPGGRECLANMLLALN